MMKHHISLFLVVFFLKAVHSFGSEEVRMINACYDPSVKTIQVTKEGEDFAAPVIDLNSDERIVFTFDDLTPGLRRFRFTVWHCAWDWSTNEDLPVSDYLEGFREENIEKFDYSYNTTVPYIHYTGWFPTASMRPKVSGNYLLVVYDDDPSATVFTCRFRVTEPSSVNVEAEVIRSTRPEDQFSKQQIDMVVKLGSLHVVNPGQEIKTVIQQNGRWDNLLAVPKARFVRTGELDYRYDESISFNGGNQFRNFDTRSLSYQSEHISKIFFDSVTHVLLVPDKPRTYGQYILESDLNGRFYISNTDHAENSATEADYALVHFFLPFPAKLASGDFYIMGELVMWSASGMAKMVFNPQRKGYEGYLFLKQGVYNYAYGLKVPSAGSIDETHIEGNHWETENDYTISIYFRETGSFYDRLVSLTTVNARPVR